MDLLFAVALALALMCGLCGKGASACPRMCVCDNYGTKHSTDCDSQDLTALPDGIPEWTTEVSLDGNYLATWDLNAFATSEYLEEISVRYNEIARIVLATAANKSDGMRGACNFAGAIFPRVKRVNLRGNRLHALPKCLLLAWPRVEVLNLNENEVTRAGDLNLADYKTPGGSLKELRLRRNRIARLARDDWYAPENAVKRLELLDLGENRVAAMEAGALLFLPELLALKLDRNRLSHVPAFAFATGRRKLTEIHLQGNQISSIARDAFAGLPALKLLDLRENLIRCLMPPAYATCAPAQASTSEDPAESRWRKMLRPHFALDLTGLNRISAEGNPWRCDCQLRPMLHNATVRRVLAQWRFERCAEPAGFRRSYLSAALSRLIDCP